MSDLAKKMGCSVGGLYRYFPSKEAIFTALQLQALSRLQDTLENNIQAHVRVSGGYTWSLVPVLFDVWTDYETAEPILAGLLNRFAWRSDAILSDDEQSIVGKKVEEIINILSNTLALLSAEGVISEGDNQLRAYLLWGMVFGFLQLRKRQHAGLPNLPLTEIRHGYLQDLQSSWTKVGTHHTVS